MQLVVELLILDIHDNKVGIEDTELTAEIIKRLKKMTVQAGLGLLIQNNQQ